MTANIEYWLERTAKSLEDVSDYLKDISLTLDGISLKLSTPMMLKGKNNEKERSQNEKSDG